ncbi:MAG: Lrp/AsnC family transcriptional regulator [gamma proteobacterium symbiont of Bathyaustriella thionipta]|nr:Lrp/AsnC family transcriptional regulator [gamma proteobacterium symbiont of Bathyaustriella thionipta]MCU7950216.1 Lrp/AsnC family transcriptional regulator [gamma proteobacterium symbiont of Bathyaustriella thionipta]MCU7952087.1 Lrp/AsnC family transcriptional regulator [gamma proteobacterium symbiont of Bathyaustriella thionipta]MCU7956757.1 Lrp/AsnC family transcriptional regulator [gamma proteobacterium symbiont of Bathyaustriella thionipta]MCU7965978.1 Lrp/AsnC family transcriptional 
MKLSKMDLRILSEIQNNSRISNLELANKIGLSPSPCLRRVKQLEDAGYIDDYVARLNEQKLALKLIALIQISMDRHTPERFENFESIVKKYEEVLECYLITGQNADYLLKVIVPDMEYYQDFLLGRLTRIEGVTGVQSSFIMRKIVDKTALPLNHL